MLDQILQKQQQKVENLPDYMALPLTHSAISLASRLQKKQGMPVHIIAEVKKASPSKGQIANISPLKQAQTYAQNSVSAISVLTESDFFSGDISDLKTITDNISTPVIRKDFIYTKNQIAEARTHGASGYLLMCSLIDRTKANLKVLIEYGRELAMDAIVECHDADSITIAVEAGARVIGVNSRNFEKADLPIEKKRFRQLLPLIPKGIVRVAESGIYQKEEIMEISDITDAVLIGTAFMQTPAEKLPAFISSLVQQ